MRNLPENLSELKNLQVLDVGNNTLETLPNNITSAYLDRTQWQKFEKSLCKNQELQYLSVNGNHIIKLPDELINCKKLRYINVSDNELIEIPAFINEFPLLTTFLAANNKITHIPRTLDECPCLETLDLIDNSLFEEEETWLLEHFKDVLISDFDDDYDYE